MLRVAALHVLALPLLPVVASAAAAKGGKPRVVLVPAFAGGGRSLVYPSSIDRAEW